ncbi:hypothetical protein GWI33_016105 [Rhynchophorus ferrugineus]|uniref:Uncharacterized protein n=1 Tax=Rhynchophorus ferrugineus TaxID=354439 RepID=A0A834MAP2_RHYFE|nr:hypothetical protein GWI33_016105 [Rhynchophorus ferrugineus]
MQGMDIIEVQCCVNVSMGKVAGIELDATGAEEELSLLLSCVDLDHGNAGRKKNKNGFTRQCMVKGLEIAL